MLTSRQYSTGAKVLLLFLTLGTIAGINLAVTMPTRHEAPVASTYSKEKVKAYAQRKLNKSDLQFECFDLLITQESDWNWTSVNHATKAYGLAQALPAIKYATQGADWKANPYTQVDWALKYLKNRYKNDACRAVRHEMIQGWW